MKRLALVALSSTMLGACSFLGGGHHADYEYAPRSTSLHMLDSVGAHPTEHHQTVSMSTGWDCGYHAPAPQPCSSASSGSALNYHVGHTEHSVPTHPHQWTQAVSDCVAVSPCGQSYNHGFSQSYQASYVEPAYVYSTHGGGSHYGLRAAPQPKRKRGSAYVTAGAQQFDIGDPFVGLQGRLGFQSSNYVGAEIEGSYGIIGDDEDIGGVIADRMIENQFAGFATVLVPLVGDLSLRGRGGYHFTEGSIEQTVAGVTTKTKNTDDGFAWGGGAEFAVDDRNAIRADYTRYHLGSSGEAFDSAALAWVHRF